MRASRQAALPLGRAPSPRHTRARTQGDGGKRAQTHTTGQTQVDGSVVKVLDDIRQELGEDP